MTPMARKWIRHGSAALIVLIIAALVGVGVQRSRQLSGASDDAVVPDIDEGRDDPAVARYTGFEYVESVAGKAIFALRSIRTLGKSSGWHEIEGVQLQLYEEGRPGPVVTAEGASFNIETRDAELRGPIAVTFPSGASITTQSGHFEASSRRFVTDSEVLFMNGATVAEAGRAMYLLSDNRVVLSERAILTSGGTSLFAPEIVYRRDDNVVEFPAGCRVVQGAAWIDAPEATVELEGPDGAPNRIELRGGVDAYHPGTLDGGALEAWTERVVGTRDGSGNWQIDANASERWISLVLYFGEGFFERRIATRRLRGVLSPDGPLNLRTEQATCITEIPREGDPRSAEARSARVWFANGQATDMELVRNVIVRGEGVEARGYRARVTTAAGIIMLHGDPVGATRAVITSERGRITCDEIQIHDRDERIEARGNVQGQIRDAAVFGTDIGDQKNQPMHFAAEMLDITENGENYRLSDGSRVWQGQRLLIADDIAYRPSDEVVDASGHVRATLPAEQLGPSPESQTDMVVVSRSLRYDRRQGRATFKGNVRYSDGLYVLAATELSAVFDDSNQITEIDAVGEVELEELATGRTLHAQRATRDVNAGTVVATGSPVKLTDASGTSVSSESLTWNQADGSVTVAGGTETVYYPEEEP
jgi:lipopolysaccharide export system protein LptA